MEKDSHLYDFFLSHANADKSIAEKLYDLLSPNCKVFLDSRCILPGQNWDEELSSAQCRSLVTVVLISPRSKEAYYQRVEVARAIEMSRREKDKHIIIPVYLGTRTFKGYTPYGLDLKQSLEVGKKGIDYVARELLTILAQHKEGTLDTIGWANQVSKLPVASSFIRGKLNLFLLTLTVISISAAVYEYIQIWYGYRWVISYVIGGLSCLIALIALLYIAFTKAKSSSGVHHEIRRSQRLYKSTLIASIIVFLFIVIAGVSLYKRNQFLRGKFIVFIADFYTEDSTKISVTDDLIDHLKRALDPYNNTLILPLGSIITESQNSTDNTARALGMRYSGNLVLWGRYNVSSTNERLIIHIESLQQYKCVPLSPTETHEIHGALSELNTFEFHKQYSEEMSALTLFLTGMIRYEAEDYVGAYKHFDDALTLTKWPEDVISKAFPLFYRGNVFDMLERYQDSFNDYSQAIQINPKLAFLYTNRAHARNHLEDYKAAIDDCSLAINLE